jgi:hypothetical protein
MSLLSDLAAFPEAGPYSINGFVAPRNTGLVPVTELRNLLDTSWSRTAMDRAVSLAGSNSVIGASCLTASGIVNPNALSLGLTGAINRFDLNGLNGILLATGLSISNVLGDLQLASSLQSLAAGLAKSISSLAGAVFGILDRALSAVPAVGQALVGMASGLVSLASKAVDLFAGAFDLARRGLIGLGNFSPAEVFSGLAGKIGGMLGNLGDGVLALTGQAAKLAGDLLGMGINVLMNPVASLSALAGLFSPITGALSSIGKGVADALGNLNMDTLKNVASKIGGALASVLGGLVDGVATAANALVSGFSNTIERFQGVMFIDGNWRNGFRTSRLAQLGLGALLAALLVKGGGSKMAKTIIGGGAAAILLATMLGNSAPVKGSFLVTDQNGWLGSPLAASGGITGALGEACAFNAALLSALGYFLNSGTSNIDALMGALECRRSTYDGVYGSALGAQNQTDYLIQRLLALLGLLNAGNYPGLCASSGLGLGRCM